MQNLIRAIVAGAAILLNITVLTPSAFSQAAIPPQVLGVTWQWVEADTPEKYTIRFLPRGAIQWRVNCDTGYGTYSIEEDGRVTLNIVLAFTAVLCRSDSLSRRFDRGLRTAKSFFLKDGDLFLELSTDSETLHFRRGGASERH